MKILKKYTTYIFLLLFLLLSACGNKSKDFNFSVKGSLQNIDSPYFYIAMEVADSVLVDTVFVDKKGDFSYRGKVDDLTIATLYFNKKTWSTSVFINKDWTVEMKGDVNYPDLIMVNGGDVNDDLTSFKKANKKLFRERANLMQLMTEAGSTEIIQTHVADFKNVNFELTNRARTYIESNRDKIASVVLIQDFYKNNSSVDALDKELALLTGKAAHHPLTKELMKYSDKVKLSQVGALAPPINIKNGKKTLSLDKYKGKFLCLIFGTDNQNVYQAQVTSLIKTYATLKPKGVEFVSIITDAPMEVTSLPDSIKWDAYFDYNGWAADVLKDYHITEMPYAILISPDGIILERGLTALILPEKIEEYIRLRKEQEKE